MLFITLFVVTIFQSLSYVRLFATHGLPHARFLDPSLCLGVRSNSHPLSQGCYLTISSSATSFSFAFILSQDQFLHRWVARRPKYWSLSFSIIPSNEDNALSSVTCWLTALAHSICSIDVINSHEGKHTSSPICHMSQEWMWCFGTQSLTFVI